MRLLGKSVENEMVISDAISGTEITVYYRTPTMQERTAWLASLFDREGTEVKDKSVETNIHWGREIMTGFANGCFGIPDGDNDVKPISSDPDSPDYRADWKDLLVEFAPEFVEFFARRVFEGNRQLFKPGPARIKYDSKN